MPHDSVRAEEATTEGWVNGGKTSERSEDYQARSYFEKREERKSEKL
jgi:hypothetical protein